MLALAGVRRPPGVAPGCGAGEPDLRAVAQAVDAVDHHLSPAARPLSITVCAASAAPVFTLRTATVLPSLTT